ncbi:MAG: hypothetical protein D6802_00405 [Ardenticatenia bacterium]|nr:MAG: hypothetical protein D6802_00405 [Ardenticatenia bacterium]
MGAKIRHASLTDKTHGDRVWKFSSIKNSHRDTESTEGFSAIPYQFFSVFSVPPCEKWNAVMMEQLTTSLRLRSLVDVS